MLVVSEMSPSLFQTSFALFGIGVLLALTNGLRIPESSPHQSSSDSVQREILAQKLERIYGNENQVEAEGVKSILASSLQKHFIQNIAGAEGVVIVIEGSSRGITPQLVKVSNIRTHIQALELKSTKKIIYSLHLAP
jgi:hypothetical protein